MRVSTRLLFVTLLAAPLAAHADGLIYKLPKDGAKIVYELKMTHTDTKSGNVREAAGTFSVASVGKAKVDGKTCRWIEFEMNIRDPKSGRQQHIAAKILVPESELGKGKTPLVHVKRGWLKQGEREAREMNDPTGREGGPLPGFLPAPLKGVKQLKPAEVKTGQGKLNCAGLTGKSSYEQGTTRFDVEYEIRFHEKAPFGVAACKIKWKEFRQKKELDDVVDTQFTLKSIGTNAQSAIPDKN